MVDCFSKLSNFTSSVSSFGKQAKIIKSKVKNLFEYNSVRKKEPLKYFQSKPIGHKKVEQLSFWNILDRNNFKIIAYPDSDLNEIYSIMTNLGLNTVQIAEAPWNQKIVGMLNRQQLERVLFKSNSRH